MQDTELDPPRVQFTYGPDAVGMTARCEFESATSPMGLTDFCWNGNISCLANPLAPAKTKRLEELRVFLERDGY